MSYRPRHIDLDINKMEENDKNWPSFDNRHWYLFLGAVIDC